MSDDYQLAKYRSIDKYFIDSLVRGYLYFSSRTDLNDPFDCNVNIKKSLENSIRLAGEKDTSLLRALLDDPAFIRLFESSVGTLGICSFSLSQNIKNHVMWSHYADDHKGVCVQYAFPLEFLDNEKEIIGVASANYGKSPITSWILENFEKYTDKHIFGMELLKKYLVSKGPGWFNELEFRIIRPSVGPFEIPKKYIKRICFGLRTSQGDITLIKEIISGFPQQVALDKVVRTDEDYGIDIVPL